MYMYVQSLMVNPSLISRPNITSLQNIRVHSITVRQAKTLTQRLCDFCLHWEHFVDGHVQ